MRDAGSTPPADGRCRVRKSVPASADPERVHVLRSRGADSPSHRLPPPAPCSGLRRSPVGCRSAFRRCCGSGRARSLDGRAPRAPWHRMGRNRTPRRTTGRSFVGDQLECRCRLRRLGHVSRLRPLLPLDDFELDAVALGERLEPSSLDGAEVHEDVRPSFSRDETVPFASLNHFTVPVRRGIARSPFKNCSRGPRASRDANGVVRAGR